MAICPRCHTSFREPEDEQGDHDCPRCGYERDENETEDDEYGEIS